MLSVGYPELSPELLVLVKVEIGELQEAGIVPDLASLNSPPPGQLVFLLGGVAKRAFENVLRLLFLAARASVQVCAPLPWL